jgi:hypothetical protein
MVAGMALMESPAIVIAVFLDRLMRKSTDDEQFSWGELLHEAFFGDAIFLLLGALFVGYISGDSGWKAEKFFVEDFPDKSMRYVEDAAENWALGIKKLEES